MAEWLITIALIIEIDQIQLNFHEKQSSFHRIIIVRLFSSEKGQSQSCACSRKDIEALSWRLNWHRRAHLSSGNIPKSPTRRIRVTTTVHLHSSAAVDEERKKKKRYDKSQILSFYCLLCHAVWDGERKERATMNSRCGCRFSTFFRFLFVMCVLFFFVFGRSSGWGSCIRYSYNVARAEQLSHTLSWRVWARARSAASSSKKPGSKQPMNPRNEAEILALYRKAIEYLQNIRLLDASLLWMAEHELHSAVSFQTCTAARWYMKSALVSGEWNV